MTNKVKLAILNSMAGRDFEKALDRHLEWGLSVLDLKDAIYGKAVEDLLTQEAHRAAQAIAARNLMIATLSTSIFYADIEQGEASFRARFSDKLARILETATILKPKHVRLLSASSSKRATFSNAADYISSRHGWVFALYREAIERIHQAGFSVVIENEVHNSIFTHPQEILDFFQVLDCGEKVGFTWDIGNLWEEGTFPSMAVYKKLKPLIRMVHVKGGYASDDRKNSGRLASSLEAASWPVTEIIGVVVRDEVSPLICLNGSHGAKNPAYSHTMDDYYRDIVFLRANFEKIE